MTDEDFYGVCPNCRHLYTEPVHPFPRDTLPACPKCGSKRRPYPIEAAGLPAPPDLVPIPAEAAFYAAKVNLILLLVKEKGYKLGAWISAPPTKGERSIARNFSVGDESGRGVVARITADEIEAAWELGDRPGHHE